MDFLYGFRFNSFLPLKAGSLFYLDPDSHIDNWDPKHCVQLDENDDRWWAGGGLLMKGVEALEHSFIIILENGFTFGYW